MLAWAAAAFSFGAASFSAQVFWSSYFWKGKFPQSVRFDFKLVNFVFIKTFKFCRDPSDVVNFLGDLHVLIELIQLGRSEKNEVLAWYETTANEFLFPTFEIKPLYHSSQRDVLMNRNEEFPVSQINSNYSKPHFSIKLCYSGNHSATIIILHIDSNRWDSNAFTGHTARIRK